MAKGEEERTRCFIKQFMEKHKQGLSVIEIANEYDLSRSTAYSKLQKIADANGVTRESLLQEVHTPTERAYRKEFQKVQVDVSSIKEQFEKARNEIGQLIESIDETLKEERNNGFYN